MCGMPGNPHHAREAEAVCHQPVFNLGIILKCVFQMLECALANSRVPYVTLIQRNTDGKYDEAVRWMS